jgi:spermidine/putrescine transport system substrate-binding protein
MLNDVRETFASALYRLGYSPNTTDEAQLDEATQMLKEQKPLVRGYFGSPEARDLVVGGDLALTLVYSGDAFTGIAENEKLAYVIPEEGATRWTDNMAIPKGATHPDVAHEFINYILEPKVGAALSNYTGYGTPNEAALPMIDPAYRDDPQVYPPPKIFDKLSVLKDLGEGTREYERRFTEIKSS